jgi:hypothetical protein
MLGTSSLIELTERLATDPYWLLSRSRSEHKRAYSRDGDQVFQTMVITDSRGS